MQFIENGPDIPERLLDEHEKGNVVFFCGAGISYAAKLPGFKKLVKELFDTFSDPDNQIQQSAMKSKMLDTVVNLLEEETAAGRERVRRKLASILTPNCLAPDMLGTHEALLTLGEKREGQMQLVTTNFDRLFEEVIAIDQSKNLFSIERFQAPLLPVPKKRWNGLVYLHGLLTSGPTIEDLDRLVISSGDFGRAYLTERWAARFVSELFRNYTICFVGYSLSDPVLRYMMDAIAADRLRGESQPEMFAFGDYKDEDGKKSEAENKWKAKHVTPILYKKDNNHTYLHETLRKWANTYKDGVRGKERIVVELARTRPIESTQQDNFVRRMLWALSDPGGLPAKTFAEFDPVPSLEWLDPLCEECYGYEYLSRFGITPKIDANDKHKFSIIRRPSPYWLSPSMSIVDSGVQRGHWDGVMRHLAQWLTRHLDDLELFFWISSRGGQLHRNFARMIEERLGEITQLEKDGNMVELERIRTNAHNGVPCPLMRKLWRLLLSGCVISKRNESEMLCMYSWSERFQRDGLTRILTGELRDNLTPRLMLSNPPEFSLGTGNSEPESIKELVVGQVVLSAGNIDDCVQKLSKNDQWIVSLPKLLPEFTNLLRDALDLMQEIEDASDQRDPSYFYHPHVKYDSYSRDFADWPVLINLTRDAWLALANKSPEQAALEAMRWWNIPYPLFRRLAFFAATQGDVIPVSCVLDWLLSDSCRWLWLGQTENEVLDLLEALVPRLKKEMPERLTRLENAILDAPNNVESGFEEWDIDRRRAMWRRLSTIDKAGADLSRAAEEQLKELSAQFEKLGETVDSLNESSLWSDEEGRQVLDSDPRHGDAWRQNCRDNFDGTSNDLCESAEREDWPADKWRKALNVWSEEEFLQKSWDMIAPVLVNAPPVLLQNAAHDMSRWLELVAKTIKMHEAHFFTLAKRLLEQEHQGGVNSNDPVMSAINHPTGKVAGALLNWWYQQSLQDNQGLSDKLKPIFTELCDRSIGRHRHGRVLLASRVITLFRVDRDWTNEKLLPLFSWQSCPIEARAVWRGFLWSPRLYRPFMEAIKEDFLVAANYYSELGGHGRQYAAFLTFAALDLSGTITKDELKTATHALPSEGLYAATRELIMELEGAGERRNEYWSNRIVPYLEDIWPKDRKKLTPEISKNLGRLCIASKDKFPEALELLRHWFQKLEDPLHLVHTLQKTELCTTYPSDVLKFLDLFIDDRTNWFSASDIKKCLEAIRNAGSELETDYRYKRLMTFAREYRGG